MLASRPRVGGRLLTSQSPQGAQGSQTPLPSRLPLQLELPTPRSSSCGAVLRIISKGDLATVQLGDESEAERV